MGLRCPADLSITGYNDMPFVDLVSPALTTVRIQHQELGAEAARLLLRKLEEPRSPIVERVLRATLVIRQSTSAPASQIRRQV